MIAQPGPPSGGPTPSGMPYAGTCKPDTSTHGEPQLLMPSPWVRFQVRNFEGTQTFG